MCCNDAPDAPDYTATAAASEYAADLAYKTSQEQLDWARQQWGDQKSMLDDVLGTQTKVMDEQHQAADKQRERR